MESIAQILTSANALPVLIFSLIVIVIGVILVKKGILSFKGKGVSLGTADGERAILRKQLEYVNSFFETFVTDPMLKDSDPIKVKYIAGKVKDIAEQAVLYNHLQRTGEYIAIKADLMYAAILKRSDADFVRSDEFKNRISDETRKLFNRLIDIRENER